MSKFKRSLVKLKAKADDDTDDLWCPQDYGPEFLPDLGPKNLNSTGVNDQIEIDLAREYIQSQIQEISSVIKEDFLAYIQQ